MPSSNVINSVTQTQNVSISVTMITTLLYNGYCLIDINSKLNI